MNFTKKLLSLLMICFIIGSAVDSLEARGGRGGGGRGGGASRGGRGGGRGWGGRGSYRGRGRGLGRGGGYWLNGVWVVGCDPLDPLCYSGPYPY